MNGSTDSLPTPVFLRVEKKLGSSLLLSLSTFQHKLLGLRKRDVHSDSDFRHRPVRSNLSAWLQPTYQPQKLLESANMLSWSLTWLEVINSESVTSTNRRRDMCLWAFFGYKNFIWIYKNQFIYHKKKEIEKIPHSQRKKLKFVN